MFGGRAVAAPLFKRFSAAHNCSQTVGEMPLDQWVAVGGGLEAYFREHETRMAHVESPLVLVRPNVNVRTVNDICHVKQQPLERAHLNCASFYNGTTCLPREDPPPPERRRERWGESDARCRERTTRSARARVRACVDMVRLTLRYIPPRRRPPYGRRLRARPLPRRVVGAALEHGLERGDVVVGREGLERGAAGHVGGLGQREGHLPVVDVRLSRALSLRGRGGARAAAARARGADAPETARPAAGAVSALAASSCCATRLRMGRWGREAPALPRRDAGGAHRAQSTNPVSDRAKPALEAPRNPSHAAQTSPFGCVF